MLNNQIIKQPVITEKTLKLANLGQFTFYVSVKTNKHSVALAIEDLFKVKVNKVRLFNVKGKPRYTGKKRYASITSKRKKAIVTLKSGDIIDYFQTPKQTPQKKTKKTLKDKIKKYKKTRKTSTQTTKKTKQHKRKVI